MKKLPLKFSRNGGSAPVVDDEYSNNIDKHTSNFHHSKIKTHHRSTTQDIMKEMNERAKSILESTSFDSTPKKLSTSPSSSPLALASVSAKLSSRNFNKHSQRYFKAHQKGFAKMEGIDQHYTVNSGNGTRQIHVQDRNFSERLGKRINLNSNLPKHSILNSSPSPKYCEKSCTDKPDLKTPSHLRTTPLNLLNQTPEQDSPKDYQTN